MEEPQTAKNARLPFWKRRLLVYPPFQLRVVGWAVSLAFASNLVFFAAIQLFLGKILAEAEAVGIPADSALMAFIRDQRQLLALLLLTVAGTTTALAVLGGLALSNRVAGPILRLCRHTDRVLSGETDRPVRFRRRDFFPELADAYNRLLASRREGP